MLQCSQFDLIKISSRKLSLIWIGFAFFFFGLFIKLSWELHEDSMLDLLDVKILTLISHLRLTSLNGPAVDISALGSPTLITIFSVLIVAILFYFKDFYGSSYIAIGTMGAGIGTYLLKHFFIRDRPSVVTHLVEVSGFSYPSGHSLSATSFYLLIMIVTWRHFYSKTSKTILFLVTNLLIMTICVSRLYLGVHYPTDVFSGILFGIAWTCFLTAYFSTTILIQNP